MAIDYGLKRVGIASTDESGSFALPRMVLPNDSLLIDKVIDFKNKEGIGRIIVGKSHDFEGRPNPIMHEVEKFTEALENRGIDIAYHPEALTTMEARQIQGGTDMTDASAAALILKSYIDSGYND